MTNIHKISSPLTHPSSSPIALLCVDDNQQVAEAVRMTFERVGGFEWKGWLSGTNALIETVRKEKPAILILDIDMPGRSPFELLEELAESFPDCRTVMFSGHVRYELIDRALTAGAWGYVSKNDGEHALVRAVNEVCNEEIALSPEVRSAYDGGLQ